MKPLTITFERLLEINDGINTLTTNPAIVNTKLGYAAKKVQSSQFKKHVEDYNDERGMNQLEHALTDEKTKELLLNEDKSYKYSKEGMKALVGANKTTWELWKGKEIEVTPFEVKDLPELTQEQTELFEGIFIKAKK